MISTAASSPHLAGDDDERDIRVESPQQLQGRGRPEAGHVVVGYDYLERFSTGLRRAPRLFHAFRGVDPLVEGLITAPTQLPMEEHHVVFGSSTTSTRKVLAAVARTFPVRASRKFGLLRRRGAVPLVPAPEREVEGRPFAHLALGPDPASVPVDDARHRRQPYARSLELVLPVQPLEGPEQLVRVSLVEAGPVVPHKVNGG